MKFRNCTLEISQSYIKFAENFLFVSRGNTECSKMNTGLREEGGEDVPRPKFNPIYFAEELRTIIGKGHGNCLEVLNEIEKKIFLSCSGQQKISSDDVNSLICDVLYLSNLIDKEIYFIDSNIPDAEYRKAAKLFPAFQAPDTKQQFIQCLKDLSSCLKDQIPQYVVD